MLTYKVLEPASETILDPSHPGLVSPDVPHLLEPLGPIKMRLEFYTQRPRSDRAGVTKHLGAIMTDFKVGDQLSWNSEAGRVSGTFIRVHPRDCDVDCYTLHTSHAPQYEIKSSKTDHVAFHKATVFTFGTATPQGADALLINPLSGIVAIEVFLRFRGQPTTGRSTLTTSQG